MSKAVLFQCQFCDRKLALTEAGRTWSWPEGVETSVGICGDCVGRLGLVVQYRPEADLDFVEYRGWKYIRPSGAPAFFRRRPLKAVPRPRLAIAPRDDRKVVLVVDDDPEVQQGIGDMLEQQGFRVAGALSGQEAMRMIERNRYDLVVLDVRLPEYNGLAVLDRLRHLDRRLGTLTPVVVITGDPQRDLRQLAEHLKVSAFLSKPFAMDRLLACMRQALSAAS